MEGAGRQRGHYRWHVEGCDLTQIFRLLQLCLGGRQEEAAMMVSGQWLVEVASAGWILIDFDLIASASTL